MKFFAAIKSFDPRRIYEDKKSFVCAISMLRVCVYNSEVEGQARGSVSGCSGIAEVNFKKNFGCLRPMTTAFFMYIL